MSDIDRVLAGILLVGAVGGAAAFASHSGSDSSAHAVRLTAPPPQHVGAPGSVVFAHTPAPTRVTVDVRRRSRQPRAPATARAGRITILSAPTQPRLVAAVPPVRAPAPTPPTPAPKRVLAAVPVAAVPLAGELKGHGRALGHANTAVVEPADPSAADPTGPGQGNGSGRTKGRATPDGD